MLLIILQGWLIRVHRAWCCANTLQVFFALNILQFNSTMSKKYEGIFVEGVGKQAHRCMNGYCSAILLMLQMLEGVYLSYSTTWVYLIICR